MSLAESLDSYLAARGVDLGTSNPASSQAVLAQTEYVRAEVNELLDAVTAWFANEQDGPERLQAVRHELADVVLAAARLASLIDTTVEDCIGQKNEHDRGRG